MWAPHRAFRPPKCGECDEVGVGGERASGVAVGPRAPVPSWTGTIPGWALWEEDGGQESWVSAVPSSGFCPSVTASERSWAGPSLSSSHSFRDWAPSMRAGGRAGHPGASPAHRALQAAPPCAPWFGVARAPGPRQQRGQGLPRRTPPRLCVLAPWWAHPRSGLSTVRPGPWDAGAGLRGKVFILRL